MAMPLARLASPEVQLACGFVNAAASTSKTHLRSLGPPAGYSSCYRIGTAILNSLAKIHEDYSSQNETVRSSHLLVNTLYDALRATRVMTS